MLEILKPLGPKNEDVPSLVVVDTSVVEHIKNYSVTRLLNIQLQTVDYTVKN